MKPVRNWTLLGLALALGYAALGAVFISHHSLVAQDTVTRSTATESLSPPPSNSLPSTNPALDPQSRVVGFGHVDVEDGTTPLAVPTIGQVEEVLVKEGQKVKSGEPLVRLRSELAESQVARATSAVAEAEIRVEQAERAPENHSLQARRQEQAVAAASAQLEGQRAQVDRLTRLAGTAAVSEENLRSSQDLLRQLEASFKSEQLKLEQLQLERPQESIRLAQVGLQASKAQLAAAQEQLAQHTLKAPEDGLILRVMVVKGQMLGVNQKSPAIWFCPNQPRIVRCEIDQEFASRVSEGMKAEISDDKVASRRWIGTVQRCADWIAPRRFLLDEPLQRNDVRTLECILTFDELEPNDLRIGQRMRVVISRGQSGSEKQPTATGRADSISDARQ